MFEDKLPRFPSSCKLSFQQQPHHSTLQQFNLDSWKYYYYYCFNLYYAHFKGSYNTVYKLYKKVYCIGICIYLYRSSRVRRHVCVFVYIEIRSQGNPH